MQNPSYIDEKSLIYDYNPTAIIGYIIFIYVFLYIQQTCLALRFSRHTFGVCIMSQLTALLYLYSCVSTLINTDCEHRLFLTCYKSTETYNLDNTNLLIAKLMIFYAMIICIGIEILFVITSFVNNISRKKYYFHKKLWREFITYFAFYFGLNIIVFIIPIACFICCITGGCQPDENNNGPNINIDWNEMLTGSELNTVLAQTHPIDYEV